MLKADHKLKPEDEVLFLSAAAQFSGERRERLWTVLGDPQQPVDYQRLISLASLNGIGPFLYRNLSASVGVPEETVSRLKHQYSKALVRNVANRQEVLEILRGLDRRGVRAIPLKGSIASDFIFEDPGIYASGDIDLLVEPSAYEAARDVIVQRGYEPESASEEDRMATHYHVAFRGLDHTVEVHWNLVKRYFSIPPGFWWEETASREYEGTDILCLSPERYLMYAAFRLFSHKFMHLRYLVFMAGLLSAHGERIDWEKLIAFAERYRMKRLILFTLRLARELLGAPVPEHVLKENMFLYDRLRNVVVSGFLGVPERESVRKVIFLSLLDSPRLVVRGLVGRIFPNPSELRIRYKIPEHSKKVYAYYLVNPFLLPFLMLKKRKQY